MENKKKINNPIEDYRTDRLVMYFVFRTLNHRTQISLEDVSHQIMNDFNYGVDSADYGARTPLMNFIRNMYFKEKGFSQIKDIVDKAKADEKSIECIENLHKKYSNLYSEYVKTKKRFGTKEEIEEVRIVRFLSELIKNALRDGTLNQKSPSYHSLTDYFPQGLYRRVFSGVRRYRNVVPDNTQVFRDISAVKDNFLEDYEFIQENKRFLIDSRNLVLKNPEMFVELYDRCQRINFDLDQQFEFAVADDLMSRIVFDRDKKAERKEINDSTPFSSIEDVELDELFSNAKTITK